MFEDVGAIDQLDIYELKVDGFPLTETTLKIETATLISKYAFIDHD